MKDRFARIKNAFQPGCEEAITSDGVAKLRLMRWRRARTVLAWTYGGVFLQFVTGNHVHTNLSTTLFLWVWLGVWAPYFAVCGTLFLRSRRKEDQFLRHLTPSDGREVIGITINTILTRSNWGRKRLYVTLGEQLAAINEETIPELDRRQHRWLRHFLKTDRHISFSSEEWGSLAVPIIRALAILGDREDLNVVELLAAGKGTGYREDIHTVAMAVLPAMQLRLQAQFAQATYLRGSEANASSELLRPTKPLPVTETQTLLRPDEQEHLSNGNTR